MITFRCPKCNREARAADEHAGKKAKCPGCGNVFQIPVGGESAPPAPKPAARPPAKPAASAPSAPAKAERPARPAPPPPAPKGRPGKDVDEDEEVVDAPEPEDEEEPEEEEEEEDRPRKGKGKGKGKKSGPKGRPGAWAPCPKCGSTDATKQHFTWWGGFIGPMMINTVRCQECGTSYNGIHGDMNTNRILIYCLAPLAVVIVLCGGCGLISTILGNLGP
jgi:phage FluMu protein Com